VIKELHFYDFDGTLFRSADPPPWWSESDGSWANQALLLGPPCTPAFPGPDWWVAQVLASARQSIDDPDVYAVLVTARNQAVFYDRIHELLAQQGLDFAEVHLNPGGEAGAYKSRVMLKLLEAQPEVQVVCMWDDRLDILTRLTNLLENKGVGAFYYHVKALPQTVPCPNLRRISRRWVRSKAE